MKEILKQYKSFIIIAILLIITVVLLFRSCRQSKINDSYQEPNKIDTTSIVKKWRDKYNKEHTTAKTMQINYANLLNTKDAELIKLREEIAKDKTITGKMVVSNTTKQTIKPKVKDSIVYVNKNDTIKESTIKLFNYKDEWLTMDGSLFPNDSMTVNYDVKNKYDFTTKFKGGNLFKKPETFVEITNLNEHTTTDKVIIYQVQQPPVTFIRSRTFNIVLGIAVGGFIGYKLAK